MSQQTHPTSTRLGVSTNWNVSYQIFWKNFKHILFQNLMISNLVEGIFLKQGILTSEIFLKWNSNSIELTVFIFLLNLKPTEFNFKKKYVFNFLKFFLEKQFAKKFFLKIFELNSYVFNVKILASWLSYEISINPQKIKQILKSIFLEFKKKNVS